MHPIPSKVGSTAKMLNRSCRAIPIPSSMYMAWKRDVFFARSTPFLLLQHRRIGKSVLTALCGVLRKPLSLPPALCGVLRKPLSSLPAL